MNAITAWKEKARSRHHRGNAGSNEGSPRNHGFWDKRRASWFNRFAASGDRSDSYALFRQHVRGEVLEIGPGPGAYTRLLVRDAARVVAVEPSPFMIDFLRQNLAEAGNLEIVPSKIEDYLGRLQRYDFALAANVLAGMECAPEVIEAVAAHSEVLVIATWDMKTPPAWMDAVRQEILGQDELEWRPPLNSDLLAILDELHLTYEVLKMGGHSFTFPNEEEALSWIEGYMAVPESLNGQLASVVAPFLERQQGRLVLPSGRESMMLKIPA